MKRYAVIIIAASTLLARPHAAVAETSATPNALEGSDTFNGLMDNLLVDLGLINGAGIETYNGFGSSGAERQMTGAISGGEPLCTDTDGGENVGCQEVAPMSREMGSAICTGNMEAPGQAEGIAVCRDGVVLITDNSTLGQYGDDAAACAAFATLPNTSNAGSPLSFPDYGVGNLARGGTLPFSGYVLGAGMGATNAWKDVLRIVYTGCLQGDGDCMTANGTGNTSSGVPSRKRSQRCDSPIRRELLSSWRYILEGEACDNSDLCEVDLSDGQLALPGHRADDGVDDTGLRHAFRRDDASGTTSSFLEFIGVRANLAGRPKITATALESIAALGCSAGLPPATAKLITPIPEQFAYCDGGHLENWAPDCQNNTIDPIGGDPIRKNCAEQDDLCGPDQKAAVVQPIKSARGYIYEAYPTHQCSRGQFAKRTFLASPHNVCPDGSKPSAGQCKLPFYMATGMPATQTFNCLNPPNSRPSTVSGTTDGRTYNIVMRSAAGVIDQYNASTYEHASWRQNMATMALSGTNNIFGKAYVAADYQCREVDATHNISCIISKSQCSVGFAARSAAYTTANNDHLFHEPLFLNGVAPGDADMTPTGGYPMARNLWFNALGGMELITTQCLARGDTAAFCADEKRIADEFWGVGLPGNILGDLCTEQGFMPIPRAQVFCKGPACGAANSADPAISMTQCVPN